MWDMQAGVLPTQLFPMPSAPVCSCLGSTSILPNHIHLRAPCSLVCFAFPHLMIFEGCFGHPCEGAPSDFACFWRLSPTTPQITVPGPVSTYLPQEEWLMWGMQAGVSAT